jgi:hypothetical protein
LNNDLGFDNIDITKGRFISDWDSNNALLFDLFDVAEDYIPTTLPCPVVSEKIRNDMEQN